MNGPSNKLFSIDAEGEQNNSITILDQNTSINPTNISSNNNSQLLYNFQENNQRSLTISSYMPLPFNINNKKAVINPQNNDDQSFKWAILAKHVTGNNKHRVNNNYFIHANKYNFNNIHFPTPFIDITIFEKNNFNTSINVYGLFQPNKKSNLYNVYPLRVVEEEKFNHFDLLMLSNNGREHYTFISNFSRLISRQKTLYGHLQLFCKRCFTSFDDGPRKNKLSGQEALDEHIKICGLHKAILPIMPNEGTMLEFEAWTKTQRHPVVIYADFEALLVKVDESKGVNTKSIQNYKNVVCKIILYTSYFV